MKHHVGASASNIAMSSVDNEIHDEFGTLQRYPVSFARIIAQKLDTILLRNHAMKCRGFLMRRSLKYSKKWQKCFYTLDMDEFTSIATRKILQAYSTKEQIYQEDIMTLRDLKRVRLDDDVQMLALPRYVTKKKQVKREDHGKLKKVTVHRRKLQDYLVLIYSNEDRILTDIVYAFKAARDFPPALQKDLTAQTNYKAILDSTVLTIKDMEKIRGMRYDADKHAFMKSKKLQKMLFKIFENEISVTAVLAKETINLGAAYITIDDSPNTVVSEQVKYRFKILMPTGKKAIENNGSYSEMVMGCSTEMQMMEWMSIIQIIQNCQGKFNMRKSESYI